VEDRKISQIKHTTDILHHIGLINSSLEMSAACYERLGFTLTPVSLPRIIPEPGRVPETFGAGNRHAIFTHNYLELLGVVNPQKWAAFPREQRGPYDLDLPLSRYEGLHVMHFGTDHIEMVKERLDKQGVACSGIREFQRNVQTQTGEHMMKARTIHFPPESNPEGLLQIAQHDTPGLVFQERYMHHRNGALALTEIMIVTETPRIYAAKYERYSGHMGKCIANNHFVVDLGLSRITVIDPERLMELIPGFVIPALPFMAAFTIKVADLQLVCDVLSGNNVPFIKKAGAVLVYPDNACGCAVIFENEHQGERE
jgi:hypothetical protein